MIQEISRLINSLRGEVWPDISTVAEYCDSPEDFLDLINTLLEEIADGCLALGVYGSRNENPLVSGSDFDLLSIQPGRGYYVQQPRGRKRLVTKSHYPENLSPGYKKPWIDLNRLSFYDVQHLSQKSFTTQKVFRKTNFLWFKNQQSKKIITAAQLVADNSRVLNQLHTARS